MNKLLAFDSKTKRHYDRNGYLHVESSHLTKEAVNPYYGREIPRWEQLRLDPEKIYKGYRAGAELEKAINTFNGLPLQLQHHMDSAINPQKEARVGSVGTSAEWNAPYIDNALSITDKTAIDVIESGACCELSAAYRYTPDFTAGVFNGEYYDFIMRDICGNHVALVAEGRAGSDVVVADSNSINSFKGAEMSDPTEQKPDGAKDSDIPAIETAFIAFADALKGDDKAAASAAFKALADVMKPFFTEERKESAHNKPAEDEDTKATKVGCDSDEPQQQKKFAEGVGYGEEKEKQEPKKLDKEHESTGAKAALDAAFVQKQTETAVMKLFRELNVAARTVRPLIGEIVDPMAFDSAEGIYKKALELKGIKTANYAPTAYHGMVDMLLKQHIAGTQSIAMDSAPKEGSPFSNVKVRIER